MLIGVKILIHIDLISIYGKDLYIKAGFFGLLLYPLYHFHRRYLQDLLLYRRIWFSKKLLERLDIKILRANIKIDILHLLIIYQVLQISILIFAGRTQGCNRDSSITVFIFTVFHDSSPILFYPKFERGHQLQTIIFKIGLVSRVISWQ